MRSFLVYLNIFCAISITPLHAAEKPEIFVQMGHTSSINAIEISPDNKFILSGSDDNSIKLWDVEEEKEIRTFAHDCPVTFVRFSPDGMFALSGDYYGKKTDGICRRKTA